MIACSRPVRAAAAMMGPHAARALLAALALTLASCGGSSPDTPAFPSAEGAPLTARTAYTTRAFRPPVTDTAPAAGWTVAAADSAQRFGIAPAAGGPVRYSALLFHRIVKVFDPQHGGSGPGDAVDAPPDFARWLANHPHLRTGQAVQVQVAGIWAVRIDVRYGSNPHTVPADCGRCVPLFVDGPSTVVYRPGVAGRFYVVNIPSGQLVVEERVSPASRFRAGLAPLEAALRSARIGRSSPSDLVAPRPGGPEGPVHSHH
jgi:hypothetical protein